MVLTLTDLKWTIDLFLFSTAFPRYYRLSPGTLVAILNPSIMPPPPHKIDTNAFSLTVSSSDDTILEIGTAGDIGFCKSVKKDGKVCESWVDARKTEFCDFHVDLQLKKTKAQRMGVNSGTGILGDRGGRARGGRKFGNKGSGDSGPNGLLTEGAVYDRTTGSTYYVAASTAGRLNHAGGFGRGSAANLIDADDPFFTSGGLQRGGDKEERFRRRLADQQRERDIAKHLGQLKSVGSEYLRADNAKSSEQSPSNPHTKGGSNSQDAGKPGLETFGLDHPKLNAQDVKLGRSKKRVLEADKGTPKAADTPKKTRFVTPKGIREAGRESLGDTMDGLTAHNHDCDDDLDII
jgi:minichromosome maintenance protein 10